jgi:NADH-quinone oxidoreductase subunit M
VNLLDLLILIPGIGFILTLFIPRKQEQMIRMFTLGVSLLTFVLSLGLATGYQLGQTGQQFVTDTVWISNPDIHWHVGIDGLSLWLIILSTLLTPIAILISWTSVKDRTKEFYAFLILLELGLVGVFAAWDLFLFYVFWEIVLVPMYFLIGIWGHDRRIYATVKFFL